MSTDRRVEKWRPKARLIQLIGAELVSSPLVAIVELVKNAYDADAKRVAVRFINSETPIIEIEDNGIGMSAHTVLDDWMVPGTAMKRKRITTDLGRRVLGEKGIGRFAAATLGDSLEMVTRQQGADEIAVFVDWSQFADEERFLDQVAIEWEARKPKVFTSVQTEVATRTDHGTLLRIWTPPDGRPDSTRPPKFDWDQLEMELRTALGRLVSPFVEIEDFRVVLVSDGTEEQVERADILGNPMYRITASVTKQGAYVAQLVTPTGSEAKHGDLKYEPLIGSFKIDLLAWDRDRLNLRPLALDLGLGLDAVRKDLDENCGISIYRDGFRVLPYGEKGDDWLGLDLRSRLKPGHNLANNQVVGAISISADQNSDLLDQTNREGIRNNGAFRALRDAILQLMDILERARARHKNPTPEKRSGPREDPLDSFRLPIVMSIAKDSHPEDQELQRAIRTEEARLVKEASRYLEVQAQYAHLATLGGLVDSLLHEGRRPLSLLRGEAQNGAAEADLWPDPYGSRSGARFRKINGHGEVLSRHFGRLEPFATRGRGRPRAIEMEGLVRDAVMFFSDEIKKYDIAVDMPQGHTKVTVDPVEIRTVIANLVDNSVYWLQRSPPPRRVRIDVIREADGSVTLTCSDNGPGVAEEDRTHIFEPYYSTKPQGTGLGLAIAGLLVQDYYSGSISLVSGGTLPGATFKVTLKRRTGVRT